MARRQHPVDPDAGPLSAFAYDLRKLREKTGNPTYRALARKAGYSPATLSEAARGQRRPSLDVTLAYVGACGGDLDEWRLRWHDLTPTEPTAAAGVGIERTDSGIPAEPAAPPPPAQTRWRRWTRPPVLAGALVLTVVAAVAIVSARPWAADEPGGPGGCAGAGADAAAGAFTGQTYTFTRVRSAAALSAPVVRSLPAGCTVVFSGYCLGDTVTDETSRTPDTRWFILPEGGVMASAVVHGNPPPALGPSSCPGGIAPPATISLNVRRSGTWLRLQATGEGAAVVGFTALHPGASGGSRWRQISLTASPASRFQARWRPPRASGQLPPGRSIVIAAVACLGGDGPTTVIDARAIQGDDPLRTASTSLSGTALDAATRSACQYPDT